MTKQCLCSRDILIFPVRNPWLGSYVSTQLDVIASLFVECLSFGSSPPVKLGQAKPMLEMRKFFTPFLFIFPAFPRILPCFFKLFLVKGWEKDGKMFPTN